MRPWQDKRQEIDLERINYGDTMKKVSIYFSILLLFPLAGLSSVHAGWDEAKTAYEHGDYETEFQEIKPLAEQGFVGAQKSLGLMYYTGNGVPKDYEEGFKWYEKAAEQGDANAQSVIGAWYYLGLGVPQDYVMAYMWLNLAAAQRLEKATRLRIEVKGHMTPKQIAEAQRLSREFKVKSP